MLMDSTENMVLLKWVYDIWQQLKPSQQILERLNQKSIHFLVTLIGQIENVEPRRS